MNHSTYSPGAPRMGSAWLAQPLWLFQFTFCSSKFLHGYSY